MEMSVPLVNAFVRLRGFRSLRSVAVDVGLNTSHLYRQLGKSSCAQVRQETIEAFACKLDVTIDRLAFTSEAVTAFILEAFFSKREPSAIEDSLKPVLQEGLKWNCVGRAQHKFAREWTGRTASSDYIRYLLDFFPNPYPLRLRLASERRGCIANSAMRVERDGEVHDIWFSSEFSFDSDLKLVNYENHYDVPAVDQMLAKRKQGNNSRSETNHCRRNGTS